MLALMMCQISFNDVQREAIVNEINEYRSFGTLNVKYVAGIFSFFVSLLTLPLVP